MNPLAKELEPLLHEAGWSWVEDRVMPGLWLMPRTTPHPERWDAYTLKDMLTLGGYSCEIYAVKDGHLLMVRRH